MRSFYALCLFFFPLADNNSLPDLSALFGALAVPDSPDSILLQDEYLDMDTDLVEAGIPPILVEEEPAVAARKEENRAFIMFFSYDKKEII